MASTDTTNWHTFEETATNVPLTGAQLNTNGDFVLALLTNITGANIAAGGVSDGAKIADDVIREDHMDWTNTNYGPRVMQIGKKLDTYQQLYVQGMAEIATVAATNTDITINFADGDVVASGAAELNFTDSPKPTVLTAYVITAGTDALVHVVAVATNSMQVNFMEAAGSDITETQTLYWAIVGDIA